MKSRRSDCQCKLLLMLIGINLSIFHFFPEIENSFYFSTDQRLPAVSLAVDLRERNCNR